ncbi:hypothetical protein CHS0354_000209 [Potamilus streckersoni]|uniref:Serrate RNA effector molecule homolog n=1 Tax=Potamilus streckersoni TaxID=2493646 RepID=A0AAE0RQD5_9BIVA|nr:hypothetical protein CHS0354_000209 [Potamilus streckersoni]
MGDSDEEYDRRKGRDKFRRERNDYDHRGRDERRRDPWEHERSSRSRDVWSGRGRDNRADNYGREYDRGRRDNRGYSPRRDISPPHPKRMRRNWYGRDDGGYPMYDMPPYGGGPMHNNGPPPNWGPGPEMGPPPGAPYGGGGPGQNRIDPEYPTQPPIMTFKQFLGQQEDNISDQDAIKKYNEYKLEFQKQQISEFFLAHKEEEWFKSKYHPEECEKRQKEVITALKKRCNVFLELLDGTYFENISVDTEKHELLVKLLDAAVIKMEGGTDFDLTVLDEPEDEVEGARNRNNSETHPVDKSPEESTRKRKREDSREEKNPDHPLEITITGEQKELMRKAQEYTKKQQQQEQNEDEDKKGKKKKRQRDKTEYSYESEESESESGSEPEPAPPGLENEPPPPGLDDTDEGEIKERKRRSSGKEGKKVDERDEDTKQEDSDDKQKIPRPRALHKTCSIFLRNLAPSITKQEVEAVCKRYPGFVRVALQDPQPERRFFRRGWVTFEKDVNIKDICWNLNNIRLRDCDLGATLNRELKQRVRPVSGLTAHKLVVRQDIRLAAKIIQNFDQKWKIWKEPEEEKKDDEKEEKDSYSFVSKNPVLMHITDYLVDEGNYEEEELLGESIEEGEKDADPEVSIDRDETLNKVLDKLILYLRIVHSIDYYSANEYPNEDEMPHRCGIIHARGVPPNSKITQTDLDDWLKNFREKVMPFTDPQDKLEDEESKKLGKKDMDAYPFSIFTVLRLYLIFHHIICLMYANSEVEKFVTANIQELAKDKWLCPLSGKKFKGPEFIRKHIFNKHGEKVEEVKKEVAFFNNYLLDRKRPQLPEHPGNKQNQNGPGQNQFGTPGGGFQGPPNPNMMGYNQPRPPMMGGYGGPPPSFGPSYGNRRDYREEPTRRYPSRNFRRSDPRNVIEYRDLDAPEDLDIL